METVLAIGVGLLLSAITQLLKKFGLEPEKVVVLLALVVGVLYQAYQTLLPEPLQGAVGAFVVGALGVSQIAYNYLKNIKK